MTTSSKNWEDLLFRGGLRTWNRKAADADGRLRTQFPADDSVDVFIAVMGERAKAFGLKLCRG